MVASEGLVTQSHAVQVFLDGQLQDDIHALTIQGATAQDHDHVAELAWQPLGPTDEPLIFHRQLRTFIQNRICEIRIRNKVVHFGKIFAGNWGYDNTGEAFLLTSRLDDHLFGAPIQFMEFDGSAYYGDLVFNPVYDGIVRPNARIAGNRFVFVHPDDVVTNDRQMWTVAAAAHYLCNQADGKYFKKPKLAELVRAFGNQQCRGDVIPFGTYLPRALTKLLRPYGFEWTVFFRNNRRYFRFWKRGTGSKRVFHCEQPGKDVTPNSNAVGVNVKVDHSNNSANEVQLIGDNIVLESTWELMPAWSEDLDDLSTTGSFSDFVIGSERWNRDPKIRRVYRDYVLNESGEYTDIREGNKKTDIYELFTLPKYAWTSSETTRSQGSGHQDRRYRFWPCITLDEDGRPAGSRDGYHIEYSIGQDDDGEEQWEVLNESIQVLEGECGISITTLRVPGYLMGIKKIRITASIKFDHRLLFWDDKKNQLKDPRIKSIDMGSKYQFKDVSPESIFAEDVAQGKRRANLVDDRQAIKALGNQVLGSFHRSTVQGSITLKDIDHDPLNMLGDTVMRISGRQVDFRGAERLWPDIIGFRIDVQDQTTSIFLDQP